MGGGGLREGAHGGARHPQPYLVEGYPLLLASLQGEGALKCLPPNIGVCQKRVSLEPLPGTILRWGGGFTPWMTCQGTIEASTCEREDASILEQHLDGQLGSLESLWIATRAHLACTPSADEALRELVTFAFVALHLFSAAWRHA